MVSILLLSLVSGRIFFLPKISAWLWSSCFLCKLHLFLCLSRPGSVIVDFFITSSEEIKTDDVISKAIYKNMKSLNFSVDVFSVAKTGKRKCCFFRTNMQNDVRYLRDKRAAMQSCNIHICPYVPDKIDMRKRDAVFPEQNMTLSCPNISYHGIIDWRFQGKKILPSDLYIFSPDTFNLTVKSVDITNNGKSLHPWQLKVTKRSGILSHVCQINICMQTSTNQQHICVISKL